MKRTLVISIEVGDAAPSGCGECPFRSLDYAMGGPDGGGELCTCPAWETAVVTGGVRRPECFAAEANARQAAEALRQLEAVRETVGAAWLAHAPSLAEAVATKTAFLGRLMVTVERARDVTRRGPRFVDRHMESAADVVVEELVMALDSDTPRESDEALVAGERGAP